VAAGKWPHIFLVDPGTEPPSGAIRESKLDACERAFNAGNPFAISKAVNICANENRPLPVWVNDAIKSLIETHVADRPAIVKKIKNDMTHLRRMEHVLMEIDIERQTRGKKLPLPEAFSRAAIRLGSELAGSKDPVRTIEASYNEGLAIANDAERRVFLAPFISEVFLQHFAAMTARKGMSRKKSSRL
jgi:hypothetical protein